MPLKLKLHIHFTKSPKRDKIYKSLPLENRKENWINILDVIKMAKGSVFKNNNYGKLSQNKSCFFSYYYLKIVRYKVKLSCVFQSI